MVTVFIINICSFINNFTPWCRIPKLCYHGKKGRYCAKRLWHVVTLQKVFGTRFWAIMANFVLKFSHFRCHGNRRGWSNVNANDTSKLLNLENPRLGNMCGSIFYISRVLAISLSKFSNFRCHGNRGRSDVNSSDTGKMLDLENPIFGATFMALCAILAELWLILC